MEFVGNLIKKVAEREGDGQNGHWKIASYLLETVEMYPKRMVVDVSDGQTARVAQWDGMISKNVVIQFDIDAREWQGRWFNSLRAWAIKASQPEDGGKRVSETAQQQAEPAVADGTGQVAEGQNHHTPENKDDYLPF